MNTCTLLTREKHNIVYFLKLANYFIILYAGCDIGFYHHSLPIRAIKVQI